LIEVVRWEEEPERLTRRRAREPRPERPPGPTRGIGVKSPGPGGGASEFVDGVAGVVGTHTLAPSKRIAFGPPPTGKVPRPNPSLARSWVTVPASLQYRSALWRGRRLAKVGKY
jgi:hypothetical protein